MHSKIKSERSAYERTRRDQLKVVKCRFKRKKFMLKKNGGQSVWHARGITVIIIKDLPGPSNKGYRDTEDQTNFEDKRLSHEMIIA